MKKLLKEYDFESENQYYEMVAESMINGQLEQAKEQFHAMPKANRKWFLEKIIWNDLSVQLDKLQKQLFLDWL